MPKLNLTKAPWSHLFAHADPGDESNPTDVRAALAEPDTSTEPFTPADVASVTGSSKGEPGGRPWLLHGELEDGRVFLIRAIETTDGWPDIVEHEHDPNCGCWTPQGVAYVAETADALRAEVAGTDDFDRLAG